MNRHLGFLDPGPQGGFDCDDEDQGGRNAAPTCNRCGAEDLEWVDVGGRPARWRLYEGNRLHVCKQISSAEADEFERL